MEIITEYLTVKINGVDHKLSFLTYESAEDVLNELSGASESKAGSVLTIKGKVLLDCGLPEAILKKLQIKHVNEIFDGVIGVKKD